MRKSKKLSWLIAVIFLFTTVLGAVPSQAVAAGLSDINGHWAQSQIQNMITKGVITGYPDNTFKPDKTISRAEFITMTNKAFSFTATSQISYSDVQASAWYAPEIAKAKAAGYIAGYKDGTMHPDAQITRQEAATILSVILKLDSSSDSAVSKFTDAASIPAWSRGYISAMVTAGYINGYPDGSFKAGKAISRAEAAVIMSNTMKPVVVPPVQQKAFDKAGTYGPASGTQTIDGDVTISADGVILQNTTIKGNLLITEAVGAGTVKLKNITVTGTTTIKGGGLNSIDIDNCNLGVVIADKADGNLRIVLSGTTTIAELVANFAVKVEGTGTIAKATIHTNGVSIESDLINKSNVKVDSGKSATIGSETVTGTTATAGGGGGGTSTTPITPTTVAVTGVTLSSANLILYKGATSTLTTTIAPTNATNQNVIWTTNKSSVATVNNGVVTAVEGGSAVITVTTADGNFTATCNVTVRVAVDNVSFKRASLSLVAGGTTAKLVAMVAPANAFDQTVAWASDNTATATVDNTGLITPLIAGTAAITATTNQGSKVATCIVTVVAAPVAVTSVDLTLTTLTLAAGGTPYDLVEIVSPANATNTNVSWSSSTPAVATVNTDGLVTPLAKGTTTIRVTTVNGSFTKDCVVTVTQPVTGIALDQPTITNWAVGDADKTLTATISPPAADDQRVIWSSADPTIVSIVSVDATGLIADIQAVKAGSAAISVTTVDGGYTANCIVTVGDRVTAITLSPLVLSLKTGGPIGTLTSTALPVVATNTNVTWTTSAPGIATVAAGVVTPVAVGTATITATPVFGTATATNGTATIKVFNVTATSMSKSAAPAYMSEVKTLAAVKFTIQGPAPDQIAVKLSDNTVLQYQNKDALTGVYTYSGSTATVAANITSATVTINNAVSFTLNF